MPRTVPVPRTVSPSGPSDTTAPSSVSSPRSPSPGWVLAAGQPGTVTVPPVSSAAARNGAALDRSGSITRSRARSTPGWTRHTSAPSSSTLPPDSRTIATDMAMCGSDGSGAALVPDLDTLVEPGTGQQQGADELRRRRRVDRDRPAGQAAGAVNGQRQGAAAPVVDPGAERPQRTDQRPDRPVPHPRITVEARPGRRRGRPPGARTASPCRPGRRRRRRGRAAHPG